MAKFNILMNGKIDYTIELLNKAKNNCIYFETFERFKHNSPMLNLVEDDPTNRAMNHDITLTNKILDFLKDEIFYSFKDIDHFVAIIRELSQYPSSIK